MNLINMNSINNDTPLNYMLHTSYNSIQAVTQQFLNNSFESTGATTVQVTTESFAILLYLAERESFLDPDLDIDIRYCKTDESSYCVSISSCYIYDSESAEDETDCTDDTPKYAGRLASMSLVRKDRLIQKILMATTEFRQAYDSNEFN